MIEKLNDYDTIIFDCDGVLLNTNFIKSVGFKNVAVKYGNEIADQFLIYHESNPGMSRYEKFDYLHCEMLKGFDHESNVENDLKEFGLEIEKEKQNCEVTTGAKELLSCLTGFKAKLFVSSGADQDELRGLLADKGLSQFFDEIFGSPRDKREHLAHLREGIELGKTLFVGDGKIDFEVASENRFDFVFVNQYSYLKDQYSVFLGHYERMIVVENLSEILP